MSIFFPRDLCIFYLYLHWYQPLAWRLLGSQHSHWKASNPQQLDSLAAERSKNIRNRKRVSHSLKSTYNSSRCRCDNTIFIVLLWLVGMKLFLGDGQAQLHFVFGRLLSLLWVDGTKTLKTNNWVDQQHRRQIAVLGFNQKQILIAQRTSEKFSLIRFLGLVLTHQLKKLTAIFDCSEKYIRHCHIARKKSL